MPLRQFEQITMIRRLLIIVTCLARSLAGTRKGSWMSKEPESAWALAMRNFIEQATDCALKSGEPAQIFLRPRTPHFDSGFDANSCSLAPIKLRLMR